MNSNETSEGQTGGLEWWFWVMLAALLLCMCCMCCILLLLYRKYSEKDDKEALLLEDSHGGDSEDGRYMILDFPYDEEADEVEKVDRTLLKAYTKALNKLFQGTGRKLQDELQDVDLSTNVKKDGPNASIVELTIVFQSAAFQKHFKNNQNIYYKYVNAELLANTRTEHLGETDSHHLSVQPTIKTVDSLRNFDFTMVRSKTGRVGTLLHDDGEEGMIMFDGGEAPEIRRANSFKVERVAE